jgi:hypothetical protein
MAIKTGIGVGAAQVFDTSGLVGNFAKMLQKQQQDEAKFQTEIADLIAKVDTKGVRDADKMEIANMYDATKELYRQAAQAKNFQEKALLRSKISKAVNDINEYAQNSAGWVKKYDNIANNMAQNPWQYDQGALDKFRSLKDIPLTKMGSNISLDPFDYQKIPDAKSRDSVFGAINRQGENFAKVTEINLPNNKYQVVKIASDDYIAKNIKERLVSMPDYRQAAIYKFRQSNPGLPLDEQSLINNEVAQYKAQYGNKYVGEPREKDGPSKSEMKDAADLSYRRSILSRLRSAEANAPQELLEISSLPYGSTSKYIMGGPSDKQFKMLRITIPRSEWQDAVSSNPALRKFDYTQGDKSSKIKAFDFKLGDGDFSRGLNEFINTFSRGSNIEFRDVKGNDTLGILNK